MPPNPRQAVVIIHGIGEQRPMETLRQFVAAVTEQDGRPLEQKAESKPDHLSPTLELRRMAVPGSQRWSAGQWVSTDFYELYWAHPDDRHRLAPRDRLDLDAPAAAMVGGPPRLQTAWWACWILGMATVIGLFTFGNDTILWWSRLGAVGAIALVVLRATGTTSALSTAVTRRAT